MLNPNRGNSSLNTLVGIIDNALSRVSTAMPVEVIQVYKNYTVDVMPMVSMLDNEGNPIDHAPITGLPYARLQGGDYGLIIEPKVGDKGLAVFASRDISGVVEKKNKSSPASLRKHSMSDGMYIASLLYEKPETYLQIEKEKITVHSKNLLVETEEIRINNKNDTTLNTDKLTVDNQDTKITTLGSITVHGNDISFTAPTVNIISENINLTAPVVNVVSADINLTGKVVIGDDAIIGGVSFKSHKHLYSRDRNITMPPQN